MQRTNPKTRITISLDATTARVLDDQRRGRGMNRSEAVEEAILEWVRSRVEGDLGRITGLVEKLDDQTRLLERATRLSTKTILEALRYQFPALNGLSDEELVRRTEERLRREGWKR
jgi:hypothetical protein